MTKTEIKQNAQDELMSAMQIAFTRATDESASDDLVAQMSRQMARVEKLFGYDAFSWHRGT